MAGTLTKRSPNPPIYIPEVPGSPGSPGEPARPAYSYTVKEERCANVFVDRGPAPLRTGGVNGRLGYWAYVCNTVERVINVPAKPAIPPVPPVPRTPAHWIIEEGVGWTAGANTVDVMFVDGEFSFQVPSAAGAVVGLVASNGTTSPREATHAFQFGSGHWGLTESGTVLPTPSGLGMPAPTALSTNTYTIRRALGRVTYIVNDVPVFVSAVPSYGPVLLDATLYLPGDTVVYLGLSDVTAGRVVAVAKPPAARLGDAYADIVAETEYPVVSMAADPIAEITAVSARFVAYAGDGFNVGMVTAMVAQPEAELDSGLPGPDYAIVLATAYHPLTAMNGLTGGIGGIDAVAQPGFAISSENSYGYCAAVAPSGYEAYMLQGPDRGLMYEAVLAGTEAAAYRYMAVAFNSTGAIVGELESTRVLSASMDSGLLASFGTTLSSILGASFAETLSFGDSGSGRRADGGGARAEDEVTWAVNYETGAYSEYEGYGFDKMYERDGLYFGTRGAEVYLLSGDDDDGTPIDAFLAFGKQNFGDTLLKHIPNVYVGVSSTGVLLLRVTTGENTYIYRARRNDTTTRTQRFDLGKGLRGSYYEFELFNEAGADFELDSVEFAVAPTARRI